MPSNLPHILRCDWNFPPQVNIWRATYGVRSLAALCLDTKKNLTEVLWQQSEARTTPAVCMGNCRNVRGLGKSMVVFRLLEKLRYSNERSTKFECIYLEKKYLEEENGKMVALQLTPKIESLYGLGRQAKKL